MTSECIDSVIAKTKGLDYEIILVDNASTDGSKEFFNRDIRVRYIYLDENLGFGRANNKGIAVAEGRNILFINSDTLLLNNAIKILSDYLDNNPKAGACGGNLLNSDYTPSFSFERYFPSVRTEVNTLFRNLPDRIRYGKNVHFNHTGKDLQVADITGADLMMKKTVLDLVGNFNPSFFLFYEETELCFRVRKSGYAIFSVPQAQIMHLIGKSSININRIQHFEKSRKTFYDLCYPRIILKIANFIRWITYYSKILFSGKEVRNHWKTQKATFIS